MQRAKWGTLLLALACVAGARVAAVTLPCTRTSSTGLANCAECIGKQCYWCAQAYSDAVYDSNGKVIKCAKTYGGTQCMTKAKDPNCAACSTQDGACARCKPRYTLAANGRCTLSSCAATSQNPGCKVCNPDGTCKACSAATQVVVPDNAQFVNRGYPASKCLTKAKANALSKEIGLVAAILPAGCVETDAFFRCSACMPGTWLDASRKCVKTMSKCPAKDYGQYCQKCDEATGKCTQCVEGRSPDAAGQCSLNCQGLYSFFCSRCTATQCTALFTSKVKDYFGS